MTEPADPAPWLPLSVVTAHLGVTGDGPRELDADRARLAACGYVEKARSDLLVTAEDLSTSYEPDAAVVYGALLLTSRLYARRSTPQGLASFGEFGPGAILRLDPDVERLLGTGRHAAPQVG